jgi:LDH2 family malate/lactate/ureidoglycolate dehydrogenase
MAIWGGVEALLGTNPLAVGIPAGEEPPVILDIATTMVSYGTIKNYALQGKTIPEGWMINRADGKPLTDPKRSNEGLLLPIGGYKGSGLALILGLLAGTLNGAAFGRDVVDFNADARTETNTGHFIVAVDVSRFTPLDVFKAEVDRHLRDLRASERLPGFDEIRIPGEQRMGRYESRLRGGVPLSSELRQKLDALASQLDIPPLRA